MHRHCMMLNLRKGRLFSMRTGRAQVSLRIRAVWSGPSLFVKIYYSIHWFCKRTTKALISLRNCLGLRFSGNCPFSCAAHRMINHLGLKSRASNCNSFLRYTLSLLSLSFWSGSFPILVFGYSHCYRKQYQAKGNTHALTRTHIHTKQHQNQHKNLQQQANKTKWKIKKKAEWQTV